MAVKWSEAPQVTIDLAKRVIETYHPELMTARIAFIMRSEAPRTNGRVTLGKAKKVSAELQLHIPYDFIIWLAKDEWLFLSAKQREALIDHELSHCAWDEDTLAAKIKPHDVEEFAHIIERHGFWWPGSDKFEVAVHAASLQPMLIADEPRREGSVGTIDFAKVAEAAEAMDGDGMDG